MSQVVQAKCPQCGQLLRVPANWVGQPIRCKNCGRVLQARAKSRTPAAPSAKPAPPPASAPPSAPFAGGSASPPESAPAPQGADVFGQLDEEPGIVLPRHRRRRRHSPWKMVVVLLVLLAVAGVGGALGIHRMGGVGKLLSSIHSSASNASAAKPSGKVPPAGDNDLPKLTKDFPRRLLAICVANYLYANPVNYGDGEQSLGSILGRLADRLHLPESQVIELSDAGNHPQRTLKPVIEKTMTDYLDASRAQDRVMILFIGHAVALEDQAYLVPVEGDLTDKDTLIPLSWVYDKLAKCKAQQKVLILDVCRYDPSRGLIRPGSGPLADKVATALKNPPPGVQVWSACAGGQYSYESTLFVSNGTYSYGGLFMGQLWEAVGPFKKSISLGIAKPEDPLPISLLANGKDGHSGVDLYTEAEAKDDFQTKPAVTDKKEGDTQDTALPNQTPQLTGAEPAGEGAFNPDEALPPKLVIQPPPPPPGGVADPTLVMNILKEAGGLVGRKGAPPLKVESMPLFDAQVMTPYVKEGKETPLRKAVLQADQLLQELSDNFTEDFAGSQDNAEIKKQILAKQEVPAKALARLSEMQEELENLKDDRPNETKRWQANYDLVMARIEERFAYTYEYDYMLGLIRKAALPARDPAKYSGWRLAPQDKLQSGGEARKHQLEAKKILTKLMNQRKGTPWEVMARRESLNAVGLQWVLIPRE